MWNPINKHTYFKKKYKPPWPCFEWDILRKMNSLYKFSSFWIRDHSYLLNNLLKVGSRLYLHSVGRLIRLALYIYWLSFIPVYQPVNTSTSYTIDLALRCVLNTDLFWHMSVPNHASLCYIMLDIHSQCYFLQPTHGR